MQLKGLVKFFTVALILISLYQLSFTFIVRNVEKKTRAKAERLVKAEQPGATGRELEKLVDARYDRLTDSMQGEKVMKVPLLKEYTFQQAKEQELNLGLDLQGGMNVTLEVSLDELVRSMSNNPNDPVLNKAIADADKAKANSQANFVTLFGEAFTKANPNAKLAYLFTKPSEKDITLNSTNEQVLAKINTEGRDAIKRTYNVLLTRIDKFGVASPNINLDENKGIITVELAGVRNPERVRTYLQSTAKLEFYETYSNQELINSLQPANDALAAYLSGVKIEDTAAKTGTTVAQTTTDSATAKAGSDTASLTSLMGGDKSATATTAAGGTDSASKANAEVQKKNPLFFVWRPNVTDQNQVNQGPVVGLVRKQDTAKLNEYLSLDVVKNKFPNNVKFVYGAEEKADVRNPNAPLLLYALRTAPGGGAKLEGDRVTDARMDYNPLTGKPEVSMSMDVAGARSWKKMTGENTGRFVAVVLDDKVYSAPLVNGEIPNGNTSISGNFTVEDATDLANILKSGKLPAPARIVQEQVVGPTLGAESIAAGMNSLLISFVVIFVLMLVYYNTGGIVANIALILNLLFTIGILSALHATLTMPGIAGLVLTIGMAVDTNVIIFERIKEELASGKSYEQAVADGYKRSYAPVLDGHITILITAVILFVFGLGPVLGFATTQIIGILLSLFTGILVSRLVTDIYMRRGRHFKYFTGLSNAIFRKAHFKFIEFRKIAYGLSVVVLLLGIASFFNGFHYGVEFSGGRSYTVKFDQEHKVEEVREKLKPSFGEYPVVKTIGTDNQVNITTSYMITQPGQEVEAQVLAKLHEGLTSSGIIPAGTSMDVFQSKYLQSSQTVLPTISDDLKAGAVKATVFSLLAIFIYILLRFRKWQYSVGTIVALLHDVCVTLAVFSFFKGIVPFALEIDQHFIAAVLTVIGFSMNDTVIVFDRVREYFRKSPNEDKKSVINRAINDTLSRTIMTSLTVFLTILILFVFGGEVTRGFAFAMLIGVVTGTYSSIFVAAPILVDMDKSGGLKQEVDREARVEELKKMA
ncbi:protein translocase subunit SecDF [Polluticoccus soli]|uniref:protein translocase subunit SecDF n=1 Tax=Polluticoccus soli TaxID=3034150 RepID=UPI0023E14B2E|nr:protein translocase subunit SecDF [Flavipsychrobacter sp. JY13-12]